VVDAAALRISRAFSLCSLLDLGRISGSSLLVRSKRFRVSFTDLLTRAFRRFAARDFWSQTRLVALVAVILARFSRALGAGWVSPDVLLLPRRLLQSVLG
jgi:hypothetical protein